MNKYLLILLALLVMGIFSFTDKGSDIANKHYSNGEISFSYPGSWNVTNGTGFVIASANNVDGLNVTILKRSIPNGYRFNEHVPLNGANVDNFHLVSTNNISVNGLNGYEVNYNWNGTEGEKWRKEIWFEKNNLLYNIIFTIPANYTKKSDLVIKSVSGNKITETLVKSLIINETNASPNKQTGWAELQMPSLGMKWTITTVSADVNGAVYHVGSSYWPGEKGEFALLGHHTTHHAPFRSIVSLKVGDSLIVKDNVTGKIYTYEVTSNGKDIRWGQTADNIKYKQTETPELLLITCWPPGYSKAAYIVHSKLVKVEPLN